jgi:hypothetical protein
VLHPVTPSYHEKVGPHRELSIEQLNAIDLLLTGTTDQAVADAVGVHRVTVTRWRLYHPHFRAALYQRRREAWAGAEDAFRTVIPMALDTLRDQLQVGTGRGRIALDVLYKTGLIGTPKDRVLSAATIHAPDHDQVLHEILDAEVRQRRAAIAAEDPDDPHLIRPSAPITDAEREAALEHLLELGNAPEITAPDRA